MKTLPSDRTGILIVRLWIESTNTDGFRARISQTLDSGQGREMSAEGSPEGVYAAVRTWVEAFVGSHE